MHTNKTQLMPAEVCFTPIRGVFELSSQPFVDARGAFLNAFRSRELSFIKAWGDRQIKQINISCTTAVGTIRGLHFQAEPYGEAKLVRCLRGRVWDVAVDLRHDSDTFGLWYAVELSPEKGNALVIPEGCGHGFQVLEQGSQLLYLHSGDWVQQAETGVRWDDPHLAVAWPLQATELSERDRSLPLLCNFNFKL